MATIIFNIISFKHNKLNAGESVVKAILRKYSEKRLTPTLTPSPSNYILLFFLPWDHSQPWECGKGKKRRAWWTDNPLQLWPGGGTFNLGSFPLRGGRGVPLIKCRAEPPGKAEGGPGTEMEPDPGQLLKTNLICTLASSPHLLKKFLREEVQFGEGRNLWSKKKL